MMSFYILLLFQVVILFLSDLSIYFYIIFSYYFYINEVDKSFKKRIQKIVNLFPIRKRASPQHVLLYGLNNLRPNIMQMYNLRPINIQGPQINNLQTFSLYESTRGVCGTLSNI